MPASVTSPADVVNVALARIGFQGRIGSLYDGSRAAKQALDIYAQTRDEILRQNDWGFAERNISMTQLKAAPPGGYVPPAGWTPAYPNPPWFFSYAYPADCLKVRSIKAAGIFVLNFDPQPITFAVENDNSYAPPQKVILCNVPNAILTYTGQITDPATWEADFVEAVCAALGRRLAPTLSTLDAAKMEVSDESAAKMTAEDERG